MSARSELPARERQPAPGSRPECARPRRPPSCLTKPVAIATSCEAVVVYDGAAMRNNAWAGGPHSATTRLEPGVGGIGRQPLGRRGRAPAFQWVALDAAAANADRRATRAPGPRNRDRD